MNADDRDKDWILAMGYALGLNSGHEIPIVPEVEVFKRFFAALRASPSEAEGKDLIAYAARYSWLREERDEQQPVVTIATFSDWGQPWRDVPLWGDELDAAVDKAMASSSRSEEQDMSTTYIGF